MEKTSNLSLDGLSPREIEVLQLIKKGLSREEIANHLDISKLTYDGYRKNIRNKLGIKSQADWAEALFQLADTKRKNI